MAKSILTITLNPSVDKSTSVQHIVPEKKLRCEKPVYEPGGGGINVSRALKRLGLASTALFTSGKDRQSARKLIKAGGYCYRSYSGEWRDPRKLYRG